MEHNRIGSEAQDSIHVSSKIHDFLDHFRIGTLLHPCGVRKHRRYSVRSLIVTIFALPFLGKISSAALLPKKMPLSAKVPLMTQLSTFMMVSG